MQAATATASGGSLRDGTARVEGNPPGRCPKRQSGSMSDEQCHGPTLAPWSFAAVVEPSPMFPRASPLDYAPKESVSTLDPTRPTGSAMQRVQASATRMPFGRRPSKRDPCAYRISPKQARSSCFPGRHPKQAQLACPPDTARASATCTPFRHRVSKRNLHVLQTPCKKKRCKWQESGFGNDRERGKRRRRVATAPDRSRYASLLHQNPSSVLRE